jgi:hypothetical protein
MTTIFYLTRFFFRFGIGTAVFGTWTSLRASASNAFQPCGFFGLLASFAMIFAPELLDAHESRVVFRSQNAVCDSLADNLPQGLKKSVEVAHEAIIEPERLFVRVAENVPRGEAYIRPLDAPFEKRPEVFHAVDVRVALPILAVSVVHPFVSHAESVISRGFVRVHRRALGYVTANLRKERYGCLATNDGGNDLAWTGFRGALQDAMHRDFIDGTAPGNLSLFLVGVHVARQTADIGCIGFSGAVEFIERFALHCQANPVKHEPRAFLSHANGASEFVRANAITVIRNAPNGHEPLIQSKGRILKDRSDLVRELLAAILASQKVARLDFADAGAFAVRASGLALPLNAPHVYVANFQVREVADGFRQCFSFAHSCFSKSWPEAHLRPKESGLEVLLQEIAGFIRNTAGFQNLRYGLPIRLCKPIISQIESLIEPAHVARIQADQVVSRKFFIRALINRVTRNLVEFVNEPVCFPLA